MSVVKIVLNINGVDTPISIDEVKELKKQLDTFFKQLKNEETITINSNFGYSSVDSIYNAHYNPNIDQLDIFGLKNGAAQPIINVSTVNGDTITL